MKQSHRIIFNTVVVWGTRVLAFFPQLIILPYLLHRLGEQRYGIYVLAWSLLQVLELALQGMSSAMIKYSSAYIAQDRIEAMNKVVGTASFYSFIVSALGCAAVIIWTRCFPKYIQVMGGEQSAAAIFSFTAIGIMVLIIFPMSPFRGILYAKQRHDLVAVVDVAFQYLKLILVVLWFTIIGPSLESLMVISVGTMILANLSMMFLAYLIQPGLKNDWSKCNWETFKVLFSFGGVIFLCTLCFMLNETGLKWIMGTLVSTSFVTHIAIMVAPVKMFENVVLAMTLTVMPVASKYDALENKQILSELFIRGTRYTALLALGAVIAAFFLLKPVLLLWLGQEYQFLSNYISIIFAGAAFAMTSNCAHHILRGLGKLRIALINSIVGQAILPVGTTLLIFLLKQQPYWAIAGGLTLGNVVYGLMQLGFCSKVIKVDYKKFIMRSYGQALLIAIPVLAFIHLVLGFIDISGFWPIISAVILGLCLSAMLFYVFFFTREERRLFNELLTSVFAILHFTRSKKVDV